MPVMLKWSKTFVDGFLADIVPCSSPPQRLCFFNKFEPPYIAVSDKIFSVLVQVWREGHGLLKS
jgi:hypothetical protein